MIRPATDASVALHEKFGLTKVAHLAELTDRPADRTVWAR